MSEQSIPEAEPRRRTRLVVGALAVLAIAGAATAVIPLQTWWEKSRVVARVNGEPVTRGELEQVLFDAEMVQQFERDLGKKNPSAQDLQNMALREIVLRRLMGLEAARRQLVVTEAEIDRAIAERRARIADAAAFAQWLSRRGLTEQTLREDVRFQLLTGKIRAALIENVRVTEAEVEEFSRAHQGQAAPSGEIKLRIIAVKERATADRVASALQRGEDFSALAKQHSTGFNAAGGGDLGWVNPGFFPPPLGEAVARMKAGETSLPLEGRQGYYIVRLEERRAGQGRPPSEARPEIERRLLAMKQQKTVEAWLVEQERAAKVEIVP